MIFQRRTPKYLLMFQRNKQRGEFQEVVLVVMSEAAAGVRRWRGDSKSKGKRKNKTDAETDRLRPATSISKTSKTSSILESLISTEVKEEEEDVPFLPALALPDSPGGWRDSPTPPPSRPSSTLPPLPELGMTSPEKQRKVRYQYQKIDF